jgi:hypothetical protein
MQFYDKFCKFYLHSLACIEINVFSLFLSNFNIGRRGHVVGILAYYSRGRAFDSRIVQIFVCMNMSVCIGPGVSMYNMYVFTKNNVYKYVLMHYLESITKAL